MNNPNVTDMYVVNNGLVHVKCQGSDPTDHTVVAQILHDVQSGANFTYWQGSGRIWLDMEERADNDPDCARIVLSQKNHTFVNTARHTIEGTGRFSGGGLRNEGLVRSVGTKGQLILYCTARNNKGKPIQVRESGRLVAANPGGMYLGLSNPANNVWEFNNLGLVEARTGSFIHFGTNATWKSSTNENQKPLGALALDGGVFAGGGRFDAEEDFLVCKNTAAAVTIAPGDLANSDGTGASTCGQLTFGRSLTMLKSVSVADLQFGSAPRRGDSIVVEGALHLAGKIRISSVDGTPPRGTYRVFTCTPGQLEVEDDVWTTMELADGIKKPTVTVNAAAGTVDFTWPNSLVVIVR